MALVFEQNGSYETSTIASGKARGDDSNGFEIRIGHWICDNSGGEPRFSKKFSNQGT
jgi:hypothetical protein